MRCRGVFSKQEMGSPAVGEVCPLRCASQVILKLPSKADTEFLWSVTHQMAALPACAGVRACRWVPFGVGGPRRWSCPLPLGCVSGPRGEATAWLCFSTSPVWIKAPVAWVSPWFSSCCKAQRLCRFQLAVRWSFVSLFFSFFFFLEAT